MPGVARKRADASSTVTLLAEIQSAAEKAQKANRRRAEALLADIARRKKTFEESFYEIGLALLEILEKKLYLALGHASFKEMLAARGVLGLTQAKQLLRIVETMSRDKAQQVGVEKAYALVRYTAATPEDDTPEGLLSSGALVGTKPASEATLREILRATRDVRKKTAPKKPRSPEEKAADDARRALSAWLGRRKVKGAEVRVLKRKEGFRIVVEIGAEQVGKVIGDD